MWSIKDQQILDDTKRKVSLKFFFYNMWYSPTVIISPLLFLRAVTNKLEVGCSLFRSKKKNVLSSFYDCEGQIFERLF